MEISKTVDEYIDKAPPELRNAAKQLRHVITETAPAAIEKISYRMPYFDYHGRLVYFSIGKDHIGLYVMSGAREALNEELEPYRGIGTKATYNFYPDKPLPVALIKKIITAQMETNDRS